MNELIKTNFEVLKFMSNKKNCAILEMVKSNSGNIRQRDVCRATKWSDTNVSGAFKKLTRFGIIKLVKGKTKRYEYNFELEKSITQLCKGIIDVKGLKQYEKKIAYLQSTIEEESIQSSQTV